MTVTGNNGLLCLAGDSRDNIGVKPLQASLVAFIMRDVEPSHLSFGLSACLLFQLSRSVLSVRKGCLCLFVGSRSVSSSLCFLNNWMLG